MGLTATATAAADSQRRSDGAGGSLGDRRRLAGRDPRGDRRIGGRRAEKFRSSVWRPLERERERESRWCDSEGGNWPPSIKKGAIFAFPH